MDIISIQSGVSPIDARGVLWTSNGRLLIDSSGSAGGMNVQSINTGVNLGSIIYADRGMLMTEAICLDFQHFEIHAGNHYMASIINTGVANAATVNISLYPTGNTAHVVFAVASEGKSRINLYEGAIDNGITGGSVISSFNSNRVSTNTSKTEIRTGVTYASGTRLFTSSLFGGTGPNSVGTAEAGRQEWMLSTGKRYVLTATNAAGSAKDIDFVLEWYEAGPNFHLAGW